MSGFNLAVEGGPNGCRVIDKGSTNGTHVTGGKLQEAMLASGDEIKSGQTVFVVRIVPDAQLPPTSSSPHAVSQPPTSASRQIPSPAPAPVRQPVVPQSVSTPAPERTYKAADAPAPPPAVQNRPAQRPVVPSPSPPAPALSPSSRPTQPPALAISTCAFHKIPDGS